MSVSGDLVADALVREYLSKCGLKETLSVLDKEKPRSEDAISNRSLLRKAVGLDKYSAKLKKRNPEEPLPTTLEMFVNHTMAKLKATELAADGSEVTSPKGRASDAKKNHTPPSSRPAASSSKPVEEDEPPSPPPRPKQGFGFTNDSLQTNSRSSRDEEPSFEPPRRPLAGAFGSDWSGPSKAPMTRAPVRASQEQMVIEEFDEEFDQDFSIPAPSRSRQLGGSATQSALSEPVSPDEISSVKAALFGRMPLPDSWKQGFFFKTDVKGLEYGLVQKQVQPM